MSVCVVLSVLFADIGDDFDDQMALSYVLSNSDLFELQMVIVSTHNTTRRALLVAYTLVQLGRFDVQIAIGEPGEDRDMPQSSWLPPGYDFTEFEAKRGIVHQNGVEALIRLVDHHSPDSPPLHYVEIAPASSLGALIAASPAILSRIQVFAMSGSINIGYMNHSRPDAEYNVYSNITASQAMYKSADYYRVQFMSASPLDTCIFQQWNGAVWSSFLSFNDSAHPGARVLLTAYQHWYDGGGKNYGALLPFSPTTGTSTMYDAQNAWVSGQVHIQSSVGARPADCSQPSPPLVSVCLNVYVNSTGYTVGDDERGSPISVQTGFIGDTYKATAAIGAQILGSIAGEQLLTSTAVLPHTE